MRSAPLLAQLTSLARGAPAEGDPPREIAGDAHGDETVTSAVRDELRLLRALDSKLLLAIPLAYHGFARRLQNGMRVLGFAREDVVAVLRAVFTGGEELSPSSAPPSAPLPAPPSAPPAGGPDASYANTADGERHSIIVARAWMVLAGADWDAIRLLSAQQLAEMDAHADGPAGAATKSRASRLRASVRYRVAVEIPHSNHRRVPRRPNFQLETPITIYNFEKIVSLFGDYQYDAELARCRRQLTRMLDEVRPRRLCTA